MYHILLDHLCEDPMYIQIYKYFVTEIHAGTISVNEKLPSSRQLAVDLGISRNTVNMAYEQLELEGYIVSKPKQGYFVCDVEGNIRLANDNNVTQKELKQKKTEEKYKVDFSPFGIDIAHAPYDRWKKIMRETMLDQDETLFQSGDSRGEKGLREAIRDYLHRSRGVKCDENQIIIGAGTEYLLMLLTRLLPDYQSIAMENPVYQQAYRVFHNFGYRIYPVSLDDNGLRVDELEKTNSKLVFVTPSHQFPMGISMPIQRRMQLLNWADEAPDRYIIEDDYDSEFRYQGKTIPALQGIDNQGKVIYMGTFSKAVAPSIRVGYLVLPKILYQRYLEEISFYATTVPRIDQEVIRRFITEGYFDRHLNRMRRIYREKCECLMNILRKWEIPIELKGDSSGLHVIVEFDVKDFDTMDRNPVKLERELTGIAKEAGIKVYPLCDYYIHECDTHRKAIIMLGYANVSTDMIQYGISRLEEVWKPLMTLHS